MSPHSLIISPTSNAIPNPDKSHHHSSGRGFVNPWPSWTKPSLFDWWSGLSWQPKGVLAEAANQAGFATSHSSEDEKDVTIPMVQTPDFARTLGRGDCVRVWWLGHAGVMLEVPRQNTSTSSSSTSTTSSLEPLRILFDPIFSQRCSPSQYLGPTRFVPPPCAISDLPRIDVVVISHNHYDHLDAETCAELWKLNEGHLRFVVPLGNKGWFEGLVGKEAVQERVTELDWWEEVTMRSSAAGSSEDKHDDDDNPISSPLQPGDISLRLICTPAQHGSGRYGLDAGSTLWASYTLFISRHGSERPFRVFFGGDTGYKLRPPSTQSVGLPKDGEGNGDATATADASSSSASPATFPACPAFAQIHDNLLGPSSSSKSSSPSSSHGAAADLLLLPISVGSTYSYVRSWDPVGFLPDVDGGLTAQNHLDTWEACEVAHVLLGKEEGGKRKGKVEGERRPTVMGMHFGTFSPHDETVDTVRRLRRACRAWEWRYVPKLNGAKGAGGDGEDKASTSQEDDGTRGDFVIVDHGGSIEVPW